jgi:diguanylate cyclase (GGDEF)-like protein/PAS domain S-box-containing protein
MTSIPDNIYLLIDCAEDVIFVLNEDGDYLYANPAALEMIGLGLGDLQALRAGDLFRLGRCLCAPHLGARQLLEWQMPSKNGGTAFVEFSTQQLPDGRVLAIGRNVSKRKKTEYELRLLAGVFEEAMEGIIITDADATMLHVNRAFAELTGYSRDELIGHNPRILQSGHQEPRFYRDMWSAVLETGRWQGEIWDRRNDGELAIMQVVIRTAQNEAGNTKHYIGFFSDITERKRQQEKTEGLAFYDALTGLPNRTLFVDRVDRALLAAQRQGGLVAVCCMDLNGFKPINDRYGHMAGDEVLAATAYRLQASMRANDTAARLGGDEFGLVLGGLHSVKEANGLVTRILHAVAEPKELSSGEIVNVTASLGVALYPGAGRDCDTLMKQADQVMYLAKREKYTEPKFYGQDADH